MFPESLHLWTIVVFIFWFWCSGTRRLTTVAGLSRARGQDRWSRIRQMGGGRQRISSPVELRQLVQWGLRSDVGWPENRLINHACDATSTGFDPPHFLGDVIGYSTWTPLTGPSRRLGKRLRAEDPRTDRGGNSDRVCADPLVKNPERGPADAPGQDSHNTRRPHPPAGSGPSCVRGRSESVAGDICYTCHHGSSGASEEEEGSANGGALALASPDGSR